ncbi:MAG: DUF192 domain-containing protein [Rhodospirillales bacterium]|nr:DUF192 domain-containing protein [Rhodospirillales bacterium]
MIHACLLAFAGLVAAAAAVPDSVVAPAWAEQVKPFVISEATIVTASGNRYPFRVELARTPDERAQGLQGRKALAADAGMLFDFEASQPVAMWMKDTYVSLDMIFIAANGRIVNIARDTTPQSLAVLESAAPVKGVLEVKAGTTARLGIRPGDRVFHKIFE